MCGIFGFYLDRPLNESDLALGQAGMAALHHRGPDNANYWADVEQGVFLGHTRLSIIDLSEQSNQPMIRHQAVLVYNGEIYNYQEIAQELSKEGLTFTSTGDTEVLLQAWHKWGANCVDHFDGMFAFALYYDRQLHLVTDPFGEKPLYWAKTSEGIYFSSESNPLVRLLSLSPDFSSKDIAAFLALGFLPGSSTGYTNLYRIEPGTWLTYSAGEQVKKVRYWVPPKPNVTRGPIKEVSEKELDAISEALIDSLRVRLRADVPLAIFLSSGVDSALVAALAAKELHSESLALTVKFSDKEVADESEAASAIAKFLRLPHKVVNSQDDPARTDPTIVFDLFGEANDNITVAAAYQMSRVASSTVRVVLSGMGGDELFYGYNKYQFLYKWRHLLSTNQKVRQFLSGRVAHFLPRRWWNLKKALSATDACRFIAVKNLPASQWLWQLPEIEALAQELFPSDIPIGLLGRHFDLTQTMPYTFIPAMERGCMRASLELRTPFLSRKLFEVISSLDQRAFIAFGQKSVLRRILARYLPDHLFDLPKRGFNYPMRRFLNSFPPHAPKVPGLPESSIMEVWQQREQRGWQRLAVRLLILEYFMSG